MRLWITAILFGLILSLFLDVKAQTAAFNFQGRLNDGASSANGRYDLRFKLFDAITGGEQIGSTITRSNLLLINGVFSTTLNFGGAAFIAGDRFLEISVRPGESEDAFVILGARQQILSVPFASRAANATNATNAETAVNAANALVAENSALLGGQPASSYARLNFPNNGNLQTSGSAGFGTAPNTRLTLSGGAPWTSNAWTASMNLQNASAVGWEANSSGQRFGIGQTNNGLNFFRTISAFGSTQTPAQYDITITNDGDVTQPVERHGLAKAMLHVDPTLPADQYILRCYNSVTNSSSGNCGFTVTRQSVGFYFVNFGFPVSNRFFSVTAESGARNASVRTAGTNAVAVDVRTILVDPGSAADGPFYLIVY
jgi:hypothetical protein